MSAPGLTSIRGSKGYFQIIFTHPDGRNKDVTFFRGAPTHLESYGGADPFGDSTASISFDTITSFDSPGSGDLFWLVPYSLVTIFWWDIQDDEPVKNTSWVWEGFVVSEEIGSPYQIQCKGALYIYDNFLAAPFYPQRPVPYEMLITRAFTQLPTKWNKPLRIDWPSDWQLKVPVFNDPSYLWFLQPWGVTTGQRWSGLTTRNTGGWEPMLTGQVQTLLSTMYSPTGDQWTVMKEYGRRPVLKVRTSNRVASDQTPVIYNGTPGVEISISRDFTQSANVIYASGKDIAGTSYSGQQVSANGESTWYEPFAALPQVYPATASNPRRSTAMVRKESRLQTTANGIDELTMHEIAMTQIRHFADPGYTGSINLRIDPMKLDRPFNRFLITAGSQILVKHIRGFDVLFHITAVSASPSDGSMSLTVDTKFREALTVAEVRARTRDALDPVNLLKAGALSVTTNDMLQPWSYSQGSGVIPSGSALDATKFFKDMPQNLQFPWTTWTKKYPPSKFPQYYIKVSKKGLKATDRWQDNGWTKSTPRSLAVPVKGAEEANIRLTQIAAYDKNGNQIPVTFHCGFYTSTGTSTNHMPMIPAAAKGIPHGYKAAERYPFFPEAFNQLKPTGEQQDNPNVMLPVDTTPYAAWGTVFEPAGYSPGLKSAGAPKTGRLMDEEEWTITPGQYDPNFSHTKVTDNAKNKTAGQIFIMIFCDDVDEVYFLGRLYRKEPGLT